MQSTVCRTGLCLRNTQSTQLRGLAMTGSRQDETPRQSSGRPWCCTPSAVQGFCLSMENAGLWKLSTMALIGFGTIRATPDGECDT